MQAWIHPATVSKPTCVNTQGKGAPQWALTRPFSHRRDVQVQSGPGTAEAPLRGSHSLPSNANVSPSRAPPLGMAAACHCPNALGPPSHLLRAQALIVGKEGLSWASPALKRSNLKMDELETLRVFSFFLSLYPILFSSCRLGTVSNLPPAHAAPPQPLLCFYQLTLGIA